MKFPLKAGIGTDGQIPFWPEKLQGPKEVSNFRLLNSEDFLSASQFDPRRRIYQKSGRCARYFLNSKVTPSGHYPWLRKGMTGLELPRSGCDKAFQSRFGDLETRVKAVDEEAARIV